MGKKGGSSWLTAVKRAFRSPSKDRDDEEKKREKRRWLFRKNTSHDDHHHHHEKQQQEEKASAAAEEQIRHAIALAIAAEATAEAEIVTAQVAAVEAVRLRRPTPSFIKAHCAAVLIQTAFRGYLARRALRALKGLVKLQALVRGHNVRKQAKMTLQYMQALIRVQASVRDQRLRLSQDGSTKSSVIISCDTPLKDSRYMQEIAERRCMSNFVNDWDERPQTIEEIQAMSQSRKNDASKRERALSYAFSHKTMRSSRNHFHPLEEDQGLEAVAEEQTAPRRMSSRSSFDIRRSSSRSRASTDNQDPIKTLETDMAGWPYSYSTPTTTNGRQSHYYSPVTPSPSKPRSVQVRSSSPRCNTPSVAAFYNYTGDAVTRHQQETIPNYMAATESARARARSNSAPRQRPGTPEIDHVGSVKKRLAFPASTTTERYYGRNNLRSPSFKSLAGRLEEMSNVSSATSCGGGEISPASTTDLRRWFR